jgi:hypothetical protein
MWVHYGKIIFSERIKNQNYTQKMFLFGEYDQQDWIIEEENGILRGFKWNENRKEKSLQLSQRIR